MWFDHIVYPLTFCITVPLGLVAFLYWYYKKEASYYLFPVSSLLQKEGFLKKPLFSYLLPALRIALLVLLALLIARPQKVDTNQKVTIEGVDIMMVMDFSGSMQLFDDPDTRKERITIAKEEALKFIAKRKSDPIGLVFFAQEAVVRCPLTLDKKVLETIIKDAQIGCINPEGTMLSQGMLTALARFKHSVAASKIIILLTDGEPSPEDADPYKALAVAEELGVKIYTIGIGGKYGGLFYDRLFNSVRQAGISLNTKLLEKIASSTGGCFFMASNSAELENIYNTIDALEKTEYETEIYKNYYDVGHAWLLVVGAIFLIEIVAASTIWFCL